MRLVMPKAVFVVGVGVIWLVAAAVVIWWALLVREIYESGLFLTVWAAAAIPTLAAAIITQRLWRWCWIVSNSRKPKKKRLSMEKPPPAPVRSKDHKSEED